MDWHDVPTRLRQLYPEALKAAAQAWVDDWAGIYVGDLGYVKLAIDLPESHGALKPLTDAFNWPQKFVGGPNPLTATLMGGALGAGLGYAGGSIAERMFPEYMQRGKARRNLAIMGGLAGAAPFALGLAMPAMQREGLPGLTHGYGLTPPSFRQHSQAGHLSDIQMGEPGASAAGPESFWKRLLKLSVDQLCQELDVQIDDKDPAFKAAADAGGAFAPVIPVDAFNQVVLTDPNTPAPVRAATAGLLTAASLSQGSNLVSPMDVARVAVSLGSGVASGLLVGKTIGMLAGLNPQAQVAAQRTGMLAGALLSVIPRIF